MRRTPGEPEAPFRGCAHQPTSLIRGCAIQKPPNGGGVSCVRPMLTPGICETLVKGHAVTEEVGSRIAVRLAYRRVAVAGVIALLGPSSSAMASPIAPAVVAPALARPAVAPVVPAPKPVRHHKTTRLCSTVTKAGRMTCFAIRQTDTVQPPGVSANAVSPNATPAGYGPPSPGGGPPPGRERGGGEDG